MSTPNSNRPPLNQLADAADSLGWDREKHGTFAEHATADDEVETVDADEYLRQLDPEVS